MVIRDVLLSKVTSDNSGSVGELKRSGDGVVN